MTTNTLDKPQGEESASAPSPSKVPRRRREKTLSVKRFHIDSSLILSIVILSLLAIVGYSYHLVLRTPPSELIETTILPNNPSCSAAAVSLPLESAEFAFAATSKLPSCTTQWFRHSGNQLFIEFAGHPNFNSEVGVFIQNRDTNTFSKLRLPAIFPSNEWKRVAIAVDPGTYRLRLQAQPHEIAWIALRRNLEQYQQTPILSRLRERIASTGAADILQSLLAIGITSLVFLTRFRNTMGIIGMFALVTALVHFRFDLFFRDDEWQLLSRLQNFNLDAILLPHNEHFLPLFLATYFLELQLFTSHYSGLVCISIVAHSLNAVLLWKLLCQLGKQTPRSIRCAGVLSLLYAVSGIHAEAIQWVAVQGQLFAITSELLGLLLLLRYEQNRSPQTLFGAVLACASAPLFFATGVLAPVHAMLFALLFFTCVRSRVYAIASLTVGLLLTLVAYTHSSVQSAPGITQLQGETSYILAVGTYLTTAISIGTVLRGIGLSVAPSQATLNQEFFGLIQLDTAGLLIPVFLCLVGVLLVYASAATQRNTWLRNLVVFGVFWIVTTLALPSIGRAMLGAAHALTLRYHTYALIGLVCCVYPLAMRFMQHLDTINTRAIRVSALLVLFALGSFHLQRQLQFSASLTQYWRDGASKRDWHARVSSAAAKRAQIDVSQILHYSDRGRRSAPALPAPIILKLVPQ